MSTQQLLNVFNFILRLQPYAAWTILLLGITTYFFYKILLKGQSFAKKFLIVETIILGSEQLFISIIQSVLQGLIWISDPHSIVKALVPPITPFSYIAGYVWMHFLKGTIFTIVGAFGLFFLLKLINKLGHDRFFYEEEYWLAALGCLAVGWPNLILYFFIAALLNVFAHIVALAIKKEGRISLLYMWPVAMIITVIFGNKIAILTGLVRLKP